MSVGVSSSLHGQTDSPSLGRLLEQKNRQIQSGSILSHDLHVILGHFQVEQGLTLTAEVSQDDLSLFFDSEQYAYDQAGNLGISIRTDGRSGLAELLSGLGFIESGSSQAHRLIEGFIPINSVQDLEQLANKGILSIRPMYRPVLEVGSVTSEADVVQQADRVRGTAPDNFDGTGISIGILSDSYDFLGGAAAGVLSGDLPAGGVTVLLDNGSSDEGRAMAELIHDVAPGADLFFATANGGQAAYAANIQSLANAGCEVIVDDVVYLAEPFFQDGIIAQQVDLVSTVDDVIYFSSAGNRSDQAYESTTINIVNTTVGGITDDFYDFDLGGGTDFLQQFTLDPGESVRLILQWDDPFYTISGVDTDLDIVAFISGTSTIVASSVTNNLLSQEPVEFLSYTNGTGAAVILDLSIIKFAGPDPTRIKYVNFGTADVFDEYDTGSPTVNPHAAADHAVAVAAAPYYLKTAESFTSHGPSTYYFEANGAPIAGGPVVRQTPDFTAIDGTNNTFFGFDLEGDGNPNFFGTSAAAPHAAAIAALIRQANPGSNRDAIYTLMNNNTRDLDAAGYDNITGSGLVDAYRSIYAAGTPAALPLTDGLESGVLSTAWELNPLGRIQVSTDNVPSAGTFHLLLDTWPINSSIGAPFLLNEAILHFDATAASNITLSFDQKEFTDEDDPMPATFAGSGNYDGVALSVDGTNWYSLVSLTGVNSGAAYSNNLIDISMFATTQGLTLGNDVRIKFQQYDNFAIASDGFAFDNISVSALVLPIELLSLRGEQAGTEGIALTWTTEQESNNDHFTLKRSMDGVEFTPFAQLKAAGDSEQLLTYQTMDRQAQPGLNYYQLYQTDFDGTTTLAQTVAVNFISHHEFQIRPNPVAADQLRFTMLSEQEGEIDLWIMDLGGRELLRSQQQIRPGQQSYEVDIQQLPAGVYLLQGRWNGVLRQERFVKM